MPRVAIIGGARNETNIDLVGSWRALGLDTELLSAADALRALGPGDVAIGRLDVVSTLDGVEPGIFDLLRLAGNGVRVVNGARALVNGHDKLRTARLLTAAGVATIPTEHVRAGEPITLAPPLVLKPRYGSWGKDVLRCDTDDELAAALAEISARSWFTRHGVLVQPLLPPLGRDLRILVAGGTAVGAEERIAAPGEWRTNISLGGSHLATLPGSAEAELAIAAVETLGGDFLGVDLMQAFGGYVVIEVNSAVEFTRIYSAPGRDVFEDVAAALQLIPAGDNATAVPA